VPHEEFDDQVNRVTRSGTRFVGQLATENGYIAFAQYSRPIIDTVRQTVVVGGDFAPEELGIGIMHALWANHTGVMSFEKKHGLKATFDAKNALRPRSHFDITIPEAPYGRIEIEEGSPSWLLRRNHWDNTKSQVGLEIPTNLHEHRRNRLMKLANDVFWLESCGDEELPSDLLGIKDFVYSAKTRSEEASQVRLFKSLAKHLANGTDDIRYTWLYDALHMPKYLYRGSLERVFLRAQAVHDLAMQVSRQKLVISGLGYTGKEGLQAVFDNQLKEPTDAELFGNMPPELI